MTRLLNTTINYALGDLRTKIREGKITVYFRDEGVGHLKRLVAGAFGYNSEVLIDKDVFNPQTIRRFEKLFDVPVGQMGSEYINNLDARYPTQDETATAIQNFINRRSDPWAHVRPSTSDLEAAAMLNT